MITNKEVLEAFQSFEIGSDEILSSSDQWRSQWRSKRIVIDSKSDCVKILSAGQREGNFCDWISTIFEASDYSEDWDEENAFSEFLRSKNFSKSDENEEELWEIYHDSDQYDRDNEIAIEFNKNEAIEETADRLAKLIDLLKDEDPNEKFDIDIIH